ncbi:transmembrane emp24 domain-containing protein eca-like [Styela clava]
MKLLLISLLCVCHVNCMFYLLGEKETRCIFDELSEGATTTFRYNSSISSGDPIGLIVRVHDPDGKLMLKREYGSGSTVTFTAHKSGEHAICTSTNSTKWAMYATGQIKVSFTVDTDQPKSSQERKIRKDDDDDDGDDDDENDEDDDEITNGGNKLISLQKRIRAVMESVEFITQTQNLYRRAEMKFRDRAETINSRVLIWACVQLAVLLSTGWYQMRSLKAFFIAKKLV